MNERHYFQICDRIREKKDHFAHFELRMPPRCHIVLPSKDVYFCNGTHDINRMYLYWGRATV